MGGIISPLIEKKVNASAKSKCRRHLPTVPISFAGPVILRGRSVISCICKVSAFTNNCLTFHDMSQESFAGN